MKTWEMTDKRGEKGCFDWMPYPIERIPLTIRLHCLLSFCKRCISGRSCVIKLCRNLAIKELQLLRISDGLYASCLMLTERHQEAVFLFKLAEIGNRLLFVVKSFVMVWERDVTAQRVDVCQSVRHNNMNSCLHTHLFNAQRFEGAHRRRHCAAGVPDAVRCWSTRRSHSDRWRHRLSLAYRAEWQSCRLRSGNPKGSASAFSC